jgi:hypothetical protein
MTNSTFAEIRRVENLSHRPYRKQAEIPDDFLKIGSLGTFL